MTKDGPVTGTLPQKTIERFMRNLEAIQKQPREWWCMICGAKWAGTRQDGPPCDCHKDPELIGVIQ